MDNFREWLSDNLRYFMLGGAILVIVAVLFFGIRACVGGGKGASDKEKTNTVEDNSQGNDPSSPEDDGETNDGKKEEDTNPLEEGDADVAAFMQSYYKALGERDVTTLKTLVSDLSASDETRISNAKDYIEGYETGNVYTKKGLDNNSYVVYTCYNYICKGIETPVPSLGYAYVVKEEDGSYRILGAADQNTKVSEYMEGLLADADVQKLRAEVQAEYDAAQKKDSALAAFLQGLGEDASKSEGGTSIMTVTEGCNVRAAADGEADIIGGLDAGTQVEKKGQEGEWIQIEYEGQTAYVYSSLLE